MLHLKHWIRRNMGCWGTKWRNRCARKEMLALWWGGSNSKYIGIGNVHYTPLFRLERQPQHAIGMPFTCNTTLHTWSTKPVGKTREAEKAEGGWEGRGGGWWCGKWLKLEQRANNSNRAPSFHRTGRAKINEAAWCIYVCCAHKSVYACTSACAFVCMCACIGAHIGAWVRACVYVRLCTLTCTCVVGYACVYAFLRGSVFNQHMRAYILSTFAYMWLHVFASMRVCTRFCIRVYAYVCVLAFMCTCVRRYARMCTYMCAWACMCICTYACLYRAWVYARCTLCEKVYLFTRCVVICECTFWCMCLDVCACMREHSMCAHRLHACT